VCSLTGNLLTTVQIKFSGTFHGFTTFLGEQMSEKWLEGLERYCSEFNIPIKHLPAILNDAKVNPMIRGKGFEFSALETLDNLLDDTVFTVSKPTMNAQIDSHDVDVLVERINPLTSYSIECKLASKGSFRVSALGAASFKVKCMRSRTIGDRVIEVRAPQLGISVKQLSAHKDSYVFKDFDVVYSSLANACYETDLDSGEYVWKPSPSATSALEKIIGPTSDLKKSAFEYVLVAKAKDLAPKFSGTTCNRRGCQDPVNCIFIPNYPEVKFDQATGRPIHPWYLLEDIDYILS
jgi:hypothetical protein